MAKRVAKKKAGRPIKLNENVLNAFETVIEENILYCTDEEIFFLVNELLEPKDRFSYTTYKNWKNNPAEPVAKSEYYPKLLSLIKKALVNERKRLLGKLEKETNQWQRWAWIIERKFDEWNLKKIIDADVKQKGTIEITSKQVFKFGDQEIEF